jgi:hypothetical protein
MRGRGTGKGGRRGKGRQAAYVHTMALVAPAPGSAEKNHSDSMLSVHDVSRVPISRWDSHVRSPHASAHVCNHTQDNTQDHRQDRTEEHTHRRRKWGVCVCVGGGCLWSELTSTQVPTCDATAASMLASTRCRTESSTTQDCSFSRPGNWALRNT